MPLELALVRFKGRTAAESAFGTLRERAGDAPWTHEAALIEHHHNDRIALHGTVAGHYVSVDEEDHLSQPGGAAGALTGGLIGIVFFGGPVGLAPGLVVGGAVGSQVARPDEVEDEPEALVEDLRTAVPKGSSAIVLVAEPAHVDDMLALLVEGADVVRRALSEEEVAALQTALRDAPPPSAGPREEGDAPPPRGDITAA